MIVQCETCQSRFKIGDDKVTERGVKVRCTKCSAVFVVRRAAAPPAATLESLAPALPRSPTLSLFADSLAADSAAASSLAAELARGHAPPHAAPAPKPAAAVRAPPPAAASLPFDALPEGLPANPGRAASPGGVAGAKASLEDLFGQLDLGADPLFAAAGTPVAADLAGSPGMASAAGQELFGDLPGLASPPPQAPPAPVSSSLDAALGPDLELGPLGGGSATPAPAFPMPTSGIGLDDPLAGLDLDPAPAHGSSPMADTGDEFLGAAGGLELGSDGALAGPAPSAAMAEPLPAAAPPQPSPAPIRASKTQAPVAPAAPETARAAVDAERSLFTIVFNSIAFGSLVVVLLLAFVVWRNGGKIDFREPGKAIFSAFGLANPSAEARSLPARVERSGLYPTVGGGQLLFVEGRVTNPSAQAVPIEVEVELVSPSGQVVGRGHGWAGRPPSPEELFSVVGADALGRLVASLRAEAPSVPPGKREQFIVALEPPDVDTSGLDIRAVARPAPPEPPSPKPALPAKPVASQGAAGG
ncbi:MAG: zinc-ribbon domain-containing protein [Deltaproteobacteria bacterium]